MDEALSRILKPLSDKFSNYANANEAFMETETRVVAAMRLHKIVMYRHFLQLLAPSGRSFFVF